MHEILGKKKCGKKLIKLKRFVWKKNFNITSNKNMSNSIITFTFHEQNSKKKIHAGRGIPHQMAPFQENTSIDVHFLRSCLSKLDIFWRWKNIGDEMDREAALSFLTNIHTNRNSEKLSKQKKPKKKLSHHNILLEGDERGGDPSVPQNIDPTYFSCNSSSTSLSRPVSHPFTTPVEMNESRKHLVNPILHLLLRDQHTQSSSSFVFSESNASTVFEESSQFKYNFLLEDCSRFLFLTWNCSIWLNFNFLFIFGS